MKKINPWILCLCISTPTLGMDALYNSVKNLVNALDQRITKLIRLHASKKKSIAWQKIFGVIEKKSHPIELYNSLEQYKAWYENLKEADHIKTRLKDLQYTIYTQQAVVAGLKDLARNHYMLENKITNMVLLTPGNSHMYYPIKAAAQHALRTAYAHAEHLNKTENRSWFQAIENVQTQVEDILAENQRYKSYLENELKKRMAHL